MDTALFFRMLADKHLHELRRMKAKYRDDFGEFLETLKETCYVQLPIKAFDGTPFVFMERGVKTDSSLMKLLVRQQPEKYGSKAAEDEIFSTSAIENIDFSRDSIRNILKGSEPRDEMENRILGQKKGFEFIADASNRITEENLHKLYRMTVGDYLAGGDRLPDGAYYRNGEVHVVNGDGSIAHSGADYNLLPERMRELVDFINTDDGIDELQKAAMIHFDVAYLHPYFDGNGRMARMLHLWYLVQKDFQSALFVPFSSLIAESRGEYYKAFSQVEENAKISGVMDVTPFLKYFADKVHGGILSVCGVKGSDKGHSGFGS